MMGCLGDDFTAQSFLYAENIQLFFSLLQIIVEK